MTVIKVRKADNDDAKLYYIMFYYWKSRYPLGYSLICNQNNETFKNPSQSQSQLLNVHLLSLMFQNLN